MLDKIHDRCTKTKQKGGNFYIKLNEDDSSSNLEMVSGPINLIDIDSMYDDDDENKTKT
jgi:hypothetical protein